jgi:GT2 family glycosyltransferase
MSSPPRISVIICSMDGSKVLPDCIQSVRDCTGPAFEVIVIDNGSTDGAPDMVEREYPDVRLIRNPENLGFAGGNNVGLQASTGEIMVLLNDDTEVPRDWLMHLEKPFRDDPRIGAVGCKLIYPDRQTIQHAGAFILANGNTGHLGVGEKDEGQHDMACERDYVTGAALALRREALDQVGLLDPGFFPIYFEEVDLQVRLVRAGWKIWYQPAAWMIHHESQTQAAGSPRFVYRYTKNRIRFLAVNGCPAVRVRDALKAEWILFFDMTFKGRMIPVLRAYLAGMIHWIDWRSDRGARKTIPRLNRQS